MSVFSGVVWRHVPVGAEPLHIGKLLKFSSGRWNRQGEYACLYTALTRDGALAELERMRASAGSAVAARDLVSIQVGRLEPVLDLTVPATYHAVAEAAGERPDAALLTGDGAAAAAPGERNLVIYFDVVAPKHVDIDNGPDRQTIRFPAT